MKTTVFTIEGMHCDGCADRIRGVLETEPGVRSVSVSFATGEARVAYNSHAVGETRLIEVIERAGFHVENA